jgi:hypothetical protein
MSHLDHVGFLENFVCGLNIELKEYVGSGHWLFEEATPILADLLAWLRAT